MIAKIIVEARGSTGEILHTIELDAEMFADGEIVKLYDAAIAALWIYKADGPPPSAVVVEPPPDERE